MNTDTNTGRNTEIAIVAGIDIGGTYTDLVFFDNRRNRVKLAKIPTNTQNQALGVIAALQQSDADLYEFDLIVHGTTVTTNAVLERKLAKTGLLTTKGFRDVLELGRRTRPQAYGMVGQFTPIIPRHLRMEISERMDASGKMVTPFSQEEARKAILHLIQQGCESLLIHFLHSYANPDHELQAEKIAEELWPNAYITSGHKLLSQSREYERGVTAAINAGVRPLLQHYVDRLQDELSQSGYRNDLLIMNGNGGMVSARYIAPQAAKTVMSGPASGVMAAAFTGRRAGQANMITFDMGGTSCDVGMICNHEPSISSEIEIEYAMPIHLPMVDIRTIGAGGGSIAWVDEAGMLQIGPQSAGADPGPICYGKNGQEPTISDAHFLLGRLNRHKLNAIENPASIEYLRKIFFTKLGEKLHLDAEAAAFAVLRIANMKMAGAIRMVSTSLGIDPRDFCLFAFGGAGPLHACTLARELGIPRIMIPARPGATNALGCVVADLRHDFVHTISQPLDTLSIENLHEIFERHAKQGRELIAKEAIGISRIREYYSLDMQFIGQTHLLRVPLPGPKPRRENLQKLFEQAYFQRFGVQMEKIRANLVHVNSSVIGIRPPFDLSALLDSHLRKNTLKEACTETRPVRFGDRWLLTPIYQREWLPQDCQIKGPAIIQQMDTTTLIEPNDSAETDMDGNIHITISE